MKKKKLTYHGRPVKVSAESYRNNGSLALMLTYDDNGETEVISVNLNHELQSGTNCFLDTNHAPDIEKWILTNHIGISLYTSCRSGFCEYPLYFINTSAL